MAKEKEEDTKCRILRFSKKLFSRGNYEAISIRDICEEAGTNVSAVSYHFGGKKELYRQCLEEHGNECLGLVQRLLSETPQSFDEFKVRLRLYTQEMFEHMFKEKDVVKMIFKEIDSDLKLSEDIFNKFYMKSGEMFEKFLQNAKEKGYLRANLEPKQLVSLQVGFLLHEIQMAGLNKKINHNDLANKSYRQQIIDQYLSILFDGAFTQQETLTHKGKQNE